MSEFHKCIKCGHTKEVGKKCQCEIFDSKVKLTTQDFGSRILTDQEYKLRGQVFQLQADLKKAVDALGLVIADSSKPLQLAGYFMALSLV